MKSNWSQAFQEPEDVREMIDNLTPGEPFTAEQEQDILAQLPSGDPEEALAASSVTTSLRLPYPLYKALKERAETQGTTPSALMRTWIEEHLDEQPPNPVVELGRALGDAVAAYTQVMKAA